MKINAQWVKDNLKADIFNYDVDSVRYGIALTLITLSNADFIVLDAEVVSWMTKILKEKERNIREIPIEEHGVHETHCCKEHGCKYRDENCPVVLEVIKQKYPCEYCEKHVL